MHSKLYATQFEHLPNVIVLSPGCHGGAAIRSAWAGRGGGNAHSILAEGQYKRCHDGSGVVALHG